MTGPAPSRALIGQSPLITFLNPGLQAVEVETTVTRGLRSVKNEDRFFVRSRASFTVSRSAEGTVGPQTDSLANVADLKLRDKGSAGIVICINIPSGISGPSW